MLSSCHCCKATIPAAGCICNIVQKLKEPPKRRCWSCMPTSGKAASPNHATAWHKYCRCPMPCLCRRPLKQRGLLLTRYGPMPAFHQGNALLCCTALQTCEVFVLGPKDHVCSRPWNSRCTQSRCFGCLMSIPDCQKASLTVMHLTAIEVICCSHSAIVCVLHAGCSDCRLGPRGSLWWVGQ